MSVGEAVQRLCKGEWSSTLDSLWGRSRISSLLQYWVIRFKVPIQNIILICIPLESTSISSAIIYHFIQLKVNQIFVADCRFLLSLETEKDKEERETCRRFAQECLGSCVYKSLQVLFPFGYSICYCACFNDIDEKRERNVRLQILLVNLYYKFEFLSTAIFNTFPNATILVQNQTYLPMWNTIYL